MHLKNYLDQLASDISSRPLPKFRDLDELAPWQNEQRQALYRQWGLDALRHQLGQAPETTVTGVLHTDRYRVEKIWFRALDEHVVTANLYVPNGLSGPAPAMLYVCGHSPAPKLRYQDHARRFAQLGFVTLIVDTVLYGEIPGTHRGTYNEGAFHWISRGYSPAAAEAWNAMRAIDLLSAREDVDPDRVGVTGHSGGGAVSWWVAATDPRIRAIASSSGTGGEASHLRDHTIDSHCDCYFPSRTDGTSLLETYALVAPRPALIVAPRLDSVYHPDSPAATVDRLRDFYGQLGRESAVELLSINAGHQYTSESRRAIFAWMLTHVAGVPTGADELSDIDGVQHAESDLLVLGNSGPLPQNANDSLPDWFLQSPARLGDTDTLRTELRENCLGFSPPGAPESMARVTRTYERHGSRVRDFVFESEPGWELKGILSQPEDAPGQGPATIELRAPEDSGPRWSTELLRRFPVSGDLALIDVRGVSDTSWHPASTWHLRRTAALLGRSIASMRIWDALCAVSALAGLTGGDDLRLRAEGDMAVVALFVAVLDPRITQLDVASLPATLDAPTDPDGRNDVIEVPHALRYADIPDLLDMVTVTHLDETVAPIPDPARSAPTLERES